MDKICSNIRSHTEGPSDYLAWFEWAAKKSRRHEQFKCPCCDLYAIWIRRHKDEEDYGEGDLTITMDVKGLPNNV